MALWRRPWRCSRAHGLELSRTFADLFKYHCLASSPQRATADAEINVVSAEDLELSDSPVKVSDY